MSENIAIYGVTGALGREVQIALEVEHEGLGDLVAVAGPRSAGQQIRWRGGSVEIVGPAEVTLPDVDIAVLATSPDVAKREAARLLHAGAKVVDASGGTDAPIVWPRLASMKAIDLEVVSAVALPSGLSSTLAPILDALLATTALGAPSPKAIDVVALTAASAAGRAGIDALSKQAVGLLSFQPVVDPAPFSHLLAFNTLTSSASDDTQHAAHLARELAALVPAAKGLAPNVVTLWTPAFSGLSLVITVRGDRPFDAGAIDALRKAVDAHPDLAFADAPEPVDPVDGEDEPGAVIAASDPDTFALRDALDQDEVRLAPLATTPDGALRIIAFADPLHRTALAAQQIVARWVAAAESD